jgi:hypothetical protein
MIVFLAVLATWWLPRLRRPWDLVGTGALLGVLVLNTLTVSFGVGGTPWTVTVVPSFLHIGPGHRAVAIWNHGYLLGGPQGGGHPERLLRAAKRDGVPRVAFEAAGPLFLNGSGMTTLARIVGEPATTQLDRLTFHDLLLVSHAIDARAPPPCAVLQPHIGIYGMWNVPANPFSGSAFHCPGSRPLRRHA